MILAGDIGGTNTRLALFENGELVFPERKFSSKSYSGLEEIVQEYLKFQRKKISRACFGVAGAVRNGLCKTTNLPWVLDERELSRSLRAPTTLLNDLQANAHGLKKLKSEELFLLHAGNPEGVGNQALIAAGTGLGEAGLFWDGNAHHPFACEGGHTDFAPRDEMEVELFFYLKKKYPHVSYERVISGPGLEEIYQFLIETGRNQESPKFKKEAKQRDAASVISEWGLLNKDPACSRAVDWFVSLYGAEAGNVALKFLSLGGFFVGGGIAPRLLEKMKSGSFVEAFLDKGRFRALLESISIWIVLNENTALLGAASYAEAQ